MKKNVEQISTDRFHSIEDLQSVFIDFETKHDVFSLMINQVYFWKLIRFDLFQQLFVSKGFLDVGHPTNKVQKVLKFFRSLKYLSLNFFRYGKGLKKSEAIFLTHGRKVKSGKYYIDPYLDLKISTYDVHQNLLIIDRPDHYGKHYKINSNNHIFLEHSFHFFSIFYDALIKIEISVEIKNVLIEFNRRFNCNVNFFRLIKTKLYKFNHERDLFKKLYSSVNPKSFYLTVSYGKEGFISSAIKYGIDVIEYQHGAINKYHMGYHFPHSQIIPYFPNIFVLNDPIWKNMVSFPKSTQVLVETSYLRHLIKNSKKDKIIFISQGSIGYKLSVIASNFSKKYEGIFYYKLHPSEFGIWKKKYTDLYKSYLKGKIIVLSNEFSIEQLLSESKYVIGVYSTVLIDALRFDCKVFLVKISGYEILNYLVEARKSILLDVDFSPVDLINQL
jgi:hypothetical protein